MTTMIGRTTDATPTVIAKIPVTEGHARVLSVIVTGREAKDAPTELASFVRSGLFTRDLGGNVALQGTAGGSTLRKTTETMACVLEANTTDQTVDVKVTGVGAKTLGWEVLVSESFAAGARDHTLAGATVLESGHYFSGDVAAKLAAASGSAVAKLYEDANNETTVTRYGSSHATKANKTEIGHKQGGNLVANVVLANGLITWQIGNGAAAADRLSLDASGHLSPAANNAQDLGTAALQYRAVYAVNAYLSVAQATRNGDTVFYSSTGDQVFRNTAAGFRTSLSVYAKSETYTKTEVDALVSALDAATYSQAETDTQIANAIAATVYTGSDKDNIAFPVGSYVIAWVDGTPNRNAAQTVRLATDNSNFDARSGAAGTALTGTWRFRGHTGSVASANVGLYQRTA